MTLCEKCIHGEICADRDCMDIDDERALQSCNDFKNKADFVEVVRCKDCKYKTFEQANNIIHCNRDRKHGTMFFKPDDFCSYGQRK